MLNIFFKYKDFFYHRAIALSLRGCTSVLDVGCGAYSTLAYIPKTFKSVGIDIYKPAIANSKKHEIHDSYVIGDAAHLERYFKPKSFDAVVALDIVEHVPKRAAYAMISQMEKIARKKVIILTPNGFRHQHAFEGNPYQTHKSGWTTDEFVKLGYSVSGLRGLKYLRKELARIRFRPWIVWAPITFVSEPIFRLFPEASFHLFAVKTLRE